MNVSELRRNALNSAFLATKLSKPDDRLALQLMAIGWTKKMLDELEARWRKAKRDCETALPEGQIEAAERMRVAWHELAKARNARVWG